MTSQDYVTEVGQLKEQSIVTLLRKICSDIETEEAPIEIIPTIAKSLLQLLDEMKQLDKSATVPGEVNEWMRRYTDYPPENLDKIPQHFLSYSAEIQIFYVIISNEMLRLQEEYDPNFTDTIIASQSEELAELLSAQINQMRMVERSRGG